jgi:hypothetical protein
MFPAQTDAMEAVLEAGLMFDQDYVAPICRGGLTPSAARGMDTPYLARYSWTC